MANYYTNLREYDRDGLPAIRPSTTGILDSTSARKYRALDQDDLLGYRSTSPTFGQGVRFESQPNRRAVSELQDQVKVFRDELRKKDAMIQNLISLDSSPKSQSRIDPIRLDQYYLGDRSHINNLNSELSTLKVKNENLQSQLRDTEHILEAKDIKIRELQSLLETNRENELRLTEIVNDLREQLHDLQNKTGSIESVAGRSEYTVAALQEENREKNDRIVQLEARLRYETTG
ncbi:polyamine-modulated factor 1-binding protein 1-like [Patella vulgata]|uniref:polyamine-modulated factor 1-binding protein 1-like n=1 Tax=Patella vulgata TaxID=6465 RepID=UPI0024A7CAB1|nr:polyamine-modulated factor 1-binding protein 1-like [Patella vulgata]